MDTKKLERIVLIILILLNAVLLALLVRGRLEERNARRETLERAAALLAERGVTVDSGVDLLQSAAVQCVVARDLELEDQRMQALLGGHGSEDMGGGIWYYRGARGQITMRGTGELNILPSGDWVSPDRDMVRQLRTLMGRAGLELEELPNAPEAGEDLYLTCCWGGFPVFNAVLDFSFSAERLDLVTGTAVFDREVSRDERVELDAVSALLRVLEEREAQGVGFSRLSGLRAGYRMSVSLNGESTLYPVWLLETDTGDYYYDGSNGRILSQLN